jgi:hypothetical protein
MLGLVERYRLEQMVNAPTEPMPTMPGGMAAYAQQHCTEDQVRTWRDMNPFGTPLWEVHGHSRAYEEECLAQGIPAQQWVMDLHYEGDSEEDALRAVWAQIHNPEGDPRGYVVFLYHLGGVYRRLDII